MARVNPSSLNNLRADNHCLYPQDGGDEAVPAPRLEGFRNPQPRHVDTAAPAGREEEDEPLLQPDDTLDVPVSSLVWGAEYLVSHFALRIGRSIEVDGCVRSTARRRVQAAAEHVARSQENSLVAMLDLIATMSQGGAWLPVMYVEHCLYDETPLEVMVRFKDEEESHKQVAKSFAAEFSWHMLLEDRVSTAGQGGNARYFKLQGKMSPSIRAAGAATGEAISEVLLSCLPASSNKAVDIFKTAVRLVEVDECPANRRAETILMEQRASTWKHFYSFCIPHKVHAIATKTFPFHDSTIQGMIHTSLRFQVGVLQAAHGTLHTYNPTTTAKGHCQDCTSILQWGLAATRNSSTCLLRSRLLHRASQLCEESVIVDGSALVHTLSRYLLQIKLASLA